MADTVILLHGVETRAGNVNWPTVLESLWHEMGANIRIKTRSYGGVFLNKVPAFVTIIPWIGWHYRERIVADQTAYLDEVLSHMAPGDRLSVLGHSFAGWIIQRWLEKGYSFHNLILIAGAMQSDFNWYRYQRQFDQAYIYWSPIDEVIRWAWFGRVGFTGPEIVHPNVESYSRQNLHSEWFNAPDLTAFSKIWHRQLTKDDR